MRKLFLFGIVTAFFAFAGFATAGSVATKSSNAQAGNGQGHHLHWFAGSVSSVAESTITVGVLWTGPNDGYLNGQTVTLTVAPNARISQGPHRRPIALAAIQMNDLVAIRAQGDSSTDLTAYMIHDRCNCHWVGGTIGTVGTSSFTVNVTRTGPYDTVLDNTAITLQVNDLTVYLRGSHRARIGLGDLQSGQGVGIVFGANGFFKAPGFDPTTAIFTAKRVHVWGNGAVPSPSTDASAAAGVST
jgi:Domain of unknown function (DUF5666)